MDRINFIPLTGKLINSYFKLTIITNNPYLRFRVVESQAIKVYLMKACMPTCILTHALYNVDFDWMMRQNVRLLE